MNLEELKKEEEILRNKLSDNLREQADIHRKAFEDKWGVKEGDLVTITERYIERGVMGSKDIHGQVSRLQFSQNGLRLFRIRLNRADGTMGKREVDIYMHEVVKIEKR